MNVLKIAATATALSVSAASQGQIVSQDFESATAAGPNPFFVHDGSGFFGPGSDFVSDGLPAGTAGAPSIFAGAGGGGVGSASAISEILVTGGVGGSQAASLTLTNDGTTDFSFGGIQTELIVVDDPTTFIATADVLAPLGAEFQIRIESPFTDTNNGFFLDFVGTGQFETVGGAVSTFAEIGAFDAASIPQLVIATPIGGSIAEGSTQIIVDNFSFAPVPEPASAALIGLGALAFASRRRKA